MATVPRCSAHPDAAAGWCCRACGSALCPACAFVQRTGSVDWIACARCGGLADPITVPRSAARPFPRWIPGALRFAAGRRAVVGLAAAAVVMGILGAFGGIGLLFRFGVLWATFFAVLRQGAAGSDDLQPPDFSELFADLLLPALRGVVALAPIWGPVVWVIGQALFGEPPGPALQALAAGALLVGLLCAPAALLLAGAGATLPAIVNPVGLFLVVRRLGRDYWLAVGVLAGLALVNGLVLVAVGDLGGIPFVSRILVEAIGLYAPITAARVLGLLLHVRGDALGVAALDDHAVPALAGAVPCGAPFAPPPPAPAAAARERFEQARAHAAGGDYPSAVAALRAAAQAGDPAVSPDALLVLARILERKLGQAAEARAVLEGLVARWPASDAARHARAALAQGAAA